VGLAFLREYLDDSLTAKEDVERAVPGVPVLALVPAVGAWKDKKWSLVASLTDPNSPAAESYRTLRTSVQFLGLDTPLKTVQVTSPLASEGKSTTIANLAVALAGAGQRVIIVDCDLRRPRIHQFFGLNNEVGLTSVLIGDTTLRAACQPTPQIKRLQVLASGHIPPNPSELLATSRMREVLRLLTEHADMVLVDCPPILPVTDASVLSHYVDATLLVATAGVTEQRQLRRAVELLGQVEAPLQGIVLNGVKDEGAYGYSYAYRYAVKPTGRGRANGRREPAPMPSADPLHFDRHPEASTGPAPVSHQAPAPEPAAEHAPGAPAPRDPRQDLGMSAVPAPVEPRPPLVPATRPEQSDPATSAQEVDRPGSASRPNGAVPPSGAGNVGQLFRLIGRSRRS
ncbi:MAG: polysaccharide biosynthesis tyrosine autokinase, partial [Actinomycetota bacterium]|nr:polysaccharide biosynthesis tyrosine autokinase [Actinomycetota bacterium]